MTWPCRCAPGACAAKSSCCPQSLRLRAQLTLRPPPSNHRLGLQAEGGVEIEKFEVTRGKDRLNRFGRADHHDVRCADCGSLLYCVVREGLWVHMPLGTLADDPGIRHTEHIFAGSKAPWYVILDDLPQHQAFA